MADFTDVLRIERLGKLCPKADPHIVEALISSTATGYGSSPTHRTGGTTDAGAIPSGKAIGYGSKSPLCAPSFIEPASFSAQGAPVTPAVTRTRRPRAARANGGSHGAG